MNYSAAGLRFASTSFSSAFWVKYGTQLIMFLRSLFRVFVRKLIIPTRIFVFFLATETVLILITQLGHDYHHQHPLSLLFVNEPIIRLYVIQNADQRR
jgi:fatty acid desaturase